MISNSCPPCPTPAIRTIKPVTPLCCVEAAPVVNRLGVKVSSVVSNTVSVFEDFIVKLVSTKGTVRPSRF